MANILLMPLSGNIYFDHGAHQACTVPDLIHCGVSLGYDGCAGVTVTSNNTAASATDRFTVAGSGGSLFSVSDALTGTVFSVNDASGLPIIEVNSDATTDTIAIGEYGTNALFVSAGNVGVGTATPTSPLDVVGNIAVTGTVDGRDLATDGTKLNSICCGATTCTGTTTPSNTQTFTNKSGNISQWTNDSGYTTCTGDITGVTAGSGLCGGGTSGTVTLNVGAGTAITVAADTVGVNSTCNSTWNAKTTCTGTTTPSNTQTFTNKSGNISQWTNDSGYTTCTGDITNVSAGTLLDGGGGSGSVTLNVDLSELTDMTEGWVTASDEFVVLDSGSQKRKLSCEIFGCNAFNSTGFTTCTGDITSVTAGNGLTGGATSGAATLNVGAGTAITVAADTVSVAGACNTLWNSHTACTGTTTPSNTQTFTNKSGCISQWTNNSGYTTCTGTTTPSNTQTFTNKSGNISQWTNNSGYTTCTGDITNVSAGDGLNGGGSSGSVAVCVDSTVARTNVDETFNCDLTVNGDLTVTGDLVCLETIVSTTSALSVTNHGSGPGLFVCQAGSNAVVNFVDAEVGSIFYVENGGNVGIRDTNPAHALDVNGCINVTGEYKIDDADVINTGKCFVGAQVRPTTAIADAYISSAACWNAKTTCTGTTTPSNTQTFTNKSGNISQWTNNSGYTGCTGTTTPSNTQTFTNKSGNISQWTNDSGYTTCTGVGNITCVTTSTGLDGGASSGTATISLDLSELTDMTAAVAPASDELILLDSGAERRKLFCEIFGCNAYSSTAFTTCTGDITAVTAGNGLTGGASSGAATLNVGAGTAITVAADTVGVNSTCNSTWNAKTTCTGTTTPSNTQTFTNKSGCISQWTNDSGYTTCIGDVTGVTAGTGMTGGGSSGTPTLNVIGGDGITANANDIAVDSTVVRTSGTQSIAGSKTFTSIPKADGLNVRSGQQLVLNAGESVTYATGQTAENVYINAESGLIVNSSPDNWASGWAGRKETYINNTSGNSNFANNITLGGTVDGRNVANDGTKLDSIACGATSCTGDITAVTAGNGLTGGATSGGATLNVGAGTAITVAADTVSVNSTCNSTWNAKTTCTGTVTCVATGTGLDGGITGSGTITLDLSELTDMTGGIDTAVDEIILLDNGAERRKRFAEIFGSNAYNSTTIATNNNQLTNGAGYTTCTGDITNVAVSTGLAGGGSSGSVTLCIDSTCNSTWNAKTTCTGTTTPSNTQTFTNKSGNISQWTNNTGYTTCTGDITGVTAGSLLDGGGSSGSVTLNVDLSELTDGTAAVVPTTDEIVYLDAGSQKRKLFSEIFGCNAYSSTAFTTCTGDITSVTAGNGLTGGASSGGATLNVGAGTAITVAADTVGVNSTCNSCWNAKTTCTGTTTPSNTQTFTNKSGCISQWTNNSGYTTCTGDITGVTAGSLLDGGGTSGSVTLNVDLSELTDGTAAIVPTSDEVVYLDAGSQKRKLFSEIFGSNAYNSTTIPTNNNQLTNGNGYTTCTGTTTPSNTQTFTNKSGNISQWTNNSGYTTCTGTTTNSNSQTFTNKSGCISQWTNNSGYTTCTGNVVTSGSTFTGSVTLNDSVCLRLGSSADLSLYHNGTSSYIDNDKNHLYIRNNVDGDDGGNIYIMPHDNENGIVINDDGGVCLYNDNAARLCTQSYGAKTQGTHCASFDMKAPIGCFCTMGIGGCSRNSSYGLCVGDCGSCCGGGSAYFAGAVQVCGSFSKASGCFDIVHPLPSLSATTRLSHSFVESPQADNIYSGVVDLTAGSATVNIDNLHGMTDGTLTALNRCFRTFTTNETNWDPVRGSVSGNTLTVESCVADSTATVSWMVLGERHDTHMREIPTTDDEGRARVEYTPPTDLYSDGDWIEIDDDV